MGFTNKVYSFRSFSFWFWVLLIYVIVALVWWFVSLERLTADMTALKLAELNPKAADFDLLREDVLLYQKRQTAKFVGEGVAFLALILAGAFFVYRSIRKQIEVSALQQNFMMAITHELKTPIATTRLSLETVLRRKLDEVQQQKLLLSALSETNRLNILTNNILLASQMEEKNFQRENEEVNLADVVETVVSDYKNRYPNRHIEASADKDLFIEGDELLIQIALSNLIDNALKYAPKDSPVYVDLMNDNDNIQVKVSDEGSGVPDEEKQKIFEKFYRSGNENTRKAKGTGLGLYLTRKIITDHNGDIFVMDNTPHGSIFVIQF
ncbi:phospho-acceptor domain-containing protein [Lacibacter cauensis]|uniref:histidine kinase n=1 Tax=Lacibacter cauensis TaxID=510947 RepID=A0A562SJQ6_9BACT|nr:ATP-binding protein [Lacibacter cauensis]TWI81491.1 phospho-acceptor domain-containing protein [Lacibacter cauensis]